jgi:NTE family protein
MTSSVTSDTSRTLREWLAQGPYALAMSSGFFGFFAHTGFLSVLEGAGFLPERLAGSSAGALISGMFASGLGTDVLARELMALERRQFWDPAPGLGLLRGRLFMEGIDDRLLARTFEACRIPVSVSVFHLRTRETRVISSGALAPALCASCAVPGLFHPMRVRGERYWDGGIFDRPGLLGLREYEANGGRVLFHHLESRSPWRARDSEAMTIPKRANLVTIVLSEMPRSGPFKLEKGRQALVHAREKMKRALDADIVDGMVRV